MNYTKKSIWFSLSATYLCFIFIPLLLVNCKSNKVISLDSSWKMDLTADNHLIIKNNWSLSEKPVDIIVYNAVGEQTHILSFTAIEDETNNFNFPKDFISLDKNEEINSISPQKLKFEVNVKRKEEFVKEFYYDPSTNPYLQLENYRFNKKIDTTLVWGKIIDAYQWQDKIGSNIVVRSYINKSTIAEDSNVVFSKYLYLYHFKKTESDTLKLVRKFSDVYGNCSELPNANFSLPSLELTDIDRDTIGEINVIYDLYCNASDTENYQSKLLLTTAGKKFMFNATINPCLMDEKKVENITTSTSFQLHPIFLRFVQKKFNEYHQL